MKILILAEHDNQDINPLTLNSVTAAKELDGEITVLVSGHNCKVVASQASEISGISKVLVCDSPAYDKAMAENTAKLLSQLAKDYDYIIATSTTSSKNIMPRLAAHIDVQAISDISGIVDHDTFMRPIYAGNVIAKVKSIDAKKVITVRSTAFDAAPNAGGSAEVEEMSVSQELGLSSFVSEEVVKSDRPELTAAGIVISGGRGMGSGENFSLLDGIADKLGATIGASRAAVDAGFVPNDLQVGQTGKIVAPELYIAVGISGAIQHLAGMKDSKVIAAINKDDEAPIFSVSDYGLVGDLFSVLPEFEEAI